MKIGLILMASGFGRRFGKNKLLEETEGKTLAERAISVYPAERFSPAAVVSRYDEVLTMGAAAGYLALPNPDAQEGISASIRRGMAHMAGTDGVLFAVCDQPWLTRESVERVLTAFEENPHRICALSWAGEKGNPCLFPREFYSQLSALTGDRGGGAVIRANPDSLFLVEAGSARELMDVDSPTDLAHGPRE